MSEKSTLSVKLREKGKFSRKEDEVPAVLYGAKRESLPITLNRKDFFKLYKEAGESTLVELDIEGKKDKPAVLIYEVQKEPITGNILHVDFFEPNLKEEVEAEVPLNFIGEAPAVKSLSGTLVKNIYSVIVKALPEKLPHEIEVDVSKLETFDDVFYAKDLPVSSEVEVLQEDDAVIAMVTAPEDVDAELEKPIEEGEEPEVEGEEKEEESEEETEQNEEKKEETS